MNNLDTISFICEAQDNSYYASDKEDGYNSYPYLTESHKDLFVTVVINNVRIGWNQAVSVYSLLLNNMNHRPYWWDASYEWSVFYPFTCSCGDAGCSGIWNGIKVKPRKRTVEWRAKFEDGYGFLGKQYFNFGRDEYVKAFNDLLVEIEQLSNECILVIDAGHCEEQLVTGDDFLKDIKSRMLK